MTQENDDPLNGFGSIERLIVRRWHAQCPSVSVLTDVPGEWRRAGPHILQYSPNRQGKRVMGRPLEHVFIKRADEDWNFSKIRNYTSEVLLSVTLENLGDFLGKTEEFPGDATGGTSAPKTVLCDSNANYLKSTFIPEDVKFLTNLHPIAPYHILMLPPGWQEQHATLESLEIAIRISRVCRRLRFTFNGMGAGASVNHLHFQGTVYPENIGIDTMGRKLLKWVETGNDKVNDKSDQLIDGNDTPSRIGLYAIPDWPMKSMYEVACEDDCSTLRFAEVVYKFVSRLQQRNITHNLSFYPGGKRVTIAARKFYCPQSENPSAMAAAALEILGHWILPGKDDYDMSTEKSLAELMNYLSIDEKTCQEIFITD